MERVGLSLVEVAENSSLPFIGEIRPEVIVRSTPEALILDGEGTYLKHSSTIILSELLCERSDVIKKFSRVYDSSATKLRDHILCGEKTLVPPKGEVGLARLIDQLDFSEQSEFIGIRLPMRTAVRSRFSGLRGIVDEPVIIITRLDAAGKITIASTYGDYPKPVFVAGL